MSINIRPLFITNYNITYVNHFYYTSQNNDLLATFFISFTFARVSKCLYGHTGRLSIGDSNVIIHWNFVITNICLFNHNRNQGRTEPAFIFVGILLFWFDSIVNQLFLSESWSLYSARLHILCLVNYYKRVATFYSQPSGD